MDEQSEGEHVPTVRVVLFVCVCVCVCGFVFGCHCAINHDQGALCAQLYQCVFVFCLMFVSCIMK